MIEKGYVYTNRYRGNLVSLTTVHEECKVLRRNIEIFYLSYECSDTYSGRRKEKRKLDFFKVAHISSSLKT